MNIFIPYYNDGKTKDKQNNKNKNTKKKGKFSKQIKKYNDHNRYNKRKTKKLDKSHSSRREYFMGGNKFDNRIVSTVFYSNNIHDSFMFDVENNLVYNSYNNHPGYRIVKQILRGVIHNDNKLLEFLSISILSLAKSIYVHNSRSKVGGLRGGGISESVGESLVNPEKKIQSKFRRHIKEVVIHLLFLVLSCYSFYRLKILLVHHMDNSVLVESNTRFDIDLYFQDSLQFNFQHKPKVNDDYFSKYIINDEIMMSRYFRIEDILNNVFSKKKMESVLKSRMNSLPIDDFESRLSNDFQFIESLFKDENQRNKFRSFTSLFIPEINSVYYMAGSRTNHFPMLEKYTLEMIKREKLIANDRVSENMKRSLYKVYDFVIIAYFLTAGSFLSMFRLINILQSSGSKMKNIDNNNVMNTGISTKNNMSDDGNNENSDINVTKAIIPYTKPMDPFRYHQKKTAMNKKETKEKKVEQTKKINSSPVNNIQNSDYILSRMKSLQSRM